MSVSPSFPSRAPHKSSFYLPSDGQRNNSQTGTLAMASREPPQSSSLRPFAAALERDRSSGLILETDKIRSPILLDVAQKYCIYFRRTPHGVFRDLQASTILGRVKWENILLSRRHFSERVEKCSLFSASLSRSRLSRSNSSACGLSFQFST